jgi:hypothetical protein
MKGNDSFSIRLRIRLDDVTDATLDVVCMLGCGDMSAVIGVIGDKHV